jgi:hypothetical protein
MTIPSRRLWSAYVLARRLAASRSTDLIFRFATLSLFTRFVFSSQCNSPAPRSANANSRKFFPVAARLVTKPTMSKRSTSACHLTGRHQSESVCRRQRMKTGSALRTQIPAWLSCYGIAGACETSCCSSWRCGCCRRRCSCSCRCSRP